MIQMTLAQIANLLGLTTAVSKVECHGISIDTRTLQPGNLFIAIAGARMDGHHFIDEAKAKGAAAVLVTHPVNTSLPQLQVTDTTTALGLLGAAWRHQFNIPIIAVTGSNGKTTLKNMAASIMVAACHGDDANVLATQGTLNNHWGLPLTLARMNRQHQYAAIEMGMNHFGEIEYLSKLTRPQVAVITNANAAHLEGVGDIAGVARAKGEIFSGLAKGGIAVLNRDDAYYTYWRDIVGTRPCLTFGFHADANIRATINTITDRQHLTIHTPKGDVDVKLPLLGTHNVLNALAATAATLAIEIDLIAIKDGLENVQPAPGRLQIHSLANGVNVIDDTYNANPFSLAAAVDTLAAFAGKKILVLGDMKELGNEEKSLHQRAGESIRQAGIDYLFTFGELSANSARAFGEGAYHFSEQEKLVNALKPFLYNTTTILVKGSRSMHMEKVVAGLMQ